MARHLIFVSKKIILVFLLLSIFSFSYAGTYFVKPDGADTSDGLDWGTAFQTIGKATSVAVEGDYIGVQAGTYPESVTVPKGVILLGGFDSAGNQDYRNNQTIIDGENIRQCVINYGGFQGFYVTNSDGSGIENVNQNSGDGDTAISGLIADCIVYNNDNTGATGGGIFSENGIVERCFVFSNNAGFGGGIYNKGATVKNCAVYNNSSFLNGAGIYNYSGSIWNCTVYGNQTSRLGSGIYNPGGVVINTIIWGDYVGVNFYPFKDINYSCFPESDGTIGEGNTKHNPFLVNVAGDVSTWDLRIQNGTPCVDRGTLQSLKYFQVPADDIDGNIRAEGDGKIDMGAYEMPAEYITNTDSRHWEMWE